MNDTQYLLTLTEREREFLKETLTGIKNASLDIEDVNVKDSTLDKLNTVSNCKIFGLEKFTEEFDDNPESRLCVLGVLTNYDINISSVVSSDNVTDKEFFLIGDMMESLLGYGLTYQEALQDALKEVLV